MRQIQLFYVSIIREKYSQRVFNTIDVAMAVNGGKQLEPHIRTLQQAVEKK